jgi:hypothetical protein
VIGTFVVPWRYLLIPFILASCFVPADQRLIIADLDFTPLRIMIIAALLRILVRAEWTAIRWNTFDKIVLSWAVVGAVIYALQWMTLGVMINRCGVLLDTIGLYWLFRISIRSWDSVRFVFKVFAGCSLVLAFFVSVEWLTGKNPFVVVGEVETVVREGRYRCQAAFPHSIIMGLFWATLLPIFIALTRTEKKKIIYWVAFVASIFIIVASASSTPLLVLPIVLMILCGYKWRRYTGRLSWCFVASLLILHILMTQPVWHLAARINIVGGSTGWHRFYLINEAINHIDEWILIGCKSTEHWGLGLQDITNQYILEGVRGGLATLVLFSIMVFGLARACLMLSLRPIPTAYQFLAWCIFAAVLGHCIAFMGVSYFGQIMMLWYMMLALGGFMVDVVGSPFTLRI